MARSGSFHNKCTLKTHHLSDFLQILWTSLLGDMPISKTIGSLLGPFWADLRECTQKVAKTASIFQLF